MITSKLTAVMAVATAFVLAAGFVPAALAQATNANTIGDLSNEANISTGSNVQANSATTTQVADNSIEISNEAESEAEAEANAESEAEGGDAESRSGDATNKGKKGEASSESEAEGGDAESEAEAEAEAESEAEATQILNDVQFNNDVTQTSATVQTNNLDDRDAVVVTQANTPVQAQVAPIAADVDLTLILLELGLLDEVPAV
jgi:hypothetical protein